MVLRAMVFSVLCIGCHAESAAPAARQRGSFHGEAGHRERTPPNIPESVVEDEAVLARATRDETCVELTLRSEQDYELAALSPTLLLDGAPTPATIHDERTATLVTPAGQPPEACERHVLGRPVAAYCVAVRTARLCAPRGALTVELRLVHPTLLDRPSITAARRPYELAFAWTTR